MKNIGTLGLLVLVAVSIMSLSLTACSTSAPAAADTAATNASSSDKAVITDSAQDAVSELLGNVSSDPEDSAVVAEKIPGISYSETDTGVFESSVDRERNLLQVKIEGADGRRVSMKNGGAIRLREGLVAEIFVDPFPTHTLTAWVDLYLHDGNGSEFKDVEVQIDYDMYSMGHGPFFTVADKSPNGHYTFRLDYVMFGPWMQLLNIPDPDLPDVEYTLEVVVVAMP